MSDADQSSNAAEAQPTRRAMPRTLPFSILALIFVLFSTYWIFQPSGTTKVWICRHFGKCKFMSETEFADWICEEIYSKNGGSCGGRELLNAYQGRDTKGDNPERGKFNDEVHEMH